MTAEKFEQLEQGARKAILTEDEQVVQDYIKQLIRRKIDVTRTWLKEVKDVRELLTKVRKGEITAEDINNFRCGMPIYNR